MYVSSFSHSVVNYTAERMSLCSAAELQPPHTHDTGKQCRSLNLNSCISCAMFTDALLRYGSVYVVSQALVRDSVFLKHHY